MKMKAKKSNKTITSKPQPIFEVVVFSLSIVLLIVGVHQTITIGFASAYWIFMLMITFLLLYTFLKGKRVMKEETKSTNKKSR